MMSNRMNRLKGYIKGMLYQASQCDRNKGHVDPDRTTAKMACLAILTEASKVGAFESMYSVINQACPNILSDRTTVKTECLTILTEAPKVGANEPRRKTASGHLLEDKEQGAQRVNDFFFLTRMILPPMRTLPLGHP